MMLRIAIFLFCLLATYPALAWTTIYEENFTTTNGGWQGLYSSTSDGNTPYYYGLGHRSDDTVNPGATATCCMIFRDINHTSPGIGQVGFLGFQTAVGIGLGSHTTWEGMRITLRVRARTGFMLPSWPTRIQWWMQRPDATNPGKMWNMSFRGVRIDERMGGGDPGTRSNNRLLETDWIDIQFVLSPDWSDWECYGARPDKMVTYSCPTTPAAFLNGVMTNFGIHFVTSDARPMINTGGEFGISLVRFETP